jgi:hypothetical protein
MEKLESQSPAPDCSRSLVQSDAPTMRTMALHRYARNAYQRETTRRSGRNAAGTGTNPLIDQVASPPVA